MNKKLKRQQNITKAVNQFLNDKEWERIVWELLKIADWAKETDLTKEEFLKLIN